MKKLLVANRGEIAVRILCAARELGIHSVAIYCRTDTSHIKFANEAIEIPETSAFLNVHLLVNLCREAQVDAVHPGYGFLSESSDFAAQLLRAGITFVGPSPEILKQTGDKVKAKQLAEICDVPVIPALQSAPSWRMVASFAEEVGYPIMLKAVDGGGGRGIRLVKAPQELEAAFERSAAESPSSTIFAEKALINGWRHVEVQILGDGDEVRHFWERECSVQRRYQKIVEIAPSTIQDRQLLGKVIDAAISIAKRIRYVSLGTFEFLVSPSTREYYFMEINPRLQVEHTVTEAICGKDLVQIQLLVASGQPLASIGLANPSAHEHPPRLSAIQLRVTAEDVHRDFALSPGRINELSLPGGNGIRVDTGVEIGTIVSTDYDSLLLKVITCTGNFENSSRKGLRALQDLHIAGVTTNQALLSGILSSDDFKKGNCDTNWLEANLKRIVDCGTTFTKLGNPSAGRQTLPATYPGAGGGTIVLKKGDAWDLSLAIIDAEAPKQYRVRIDKLSRNNLPSELRAAITVQGADRATRDVSYTVELDQAGNSAHYGHAGNNHRKGDVSNPSHLTCPLTGQLVETLVDEGDEVDEHEPVAIIRQMKMELEVRAHRKGIVKALWDVDDGENVDMGTLVCEIEATKSTKSKL